MLYFKSRSSAIRKKAALAAAITLFVLPIGMSSALAHGGATVDDIVNFKPVIGSGSAAAPATTAAPVATVAPKAAAPKAAAPVATAAPKAAAAKATPVAAAAPAAAAPATGSVQTIDIKDFAFPEVTTVMVGTTVTWTNRDSAVHTVTSGPRGAPDGKFDAKLSQGQSFSFQFNEVGTFDYYCKPHANMNAKIMVVDAAAPAAAAPQAAAAPAVSGTAATAATNANAGRINLIEQPLSEADKNFLRAVKTAGLWEMPAGLMAQEKSTNPMIQDVGKKLHAEHAELNTAVDEVAGILSVELPTVATPQQQAFLNEFTRATGPQFDEIWVMRLRQAHGSVFNTIAAVRTTTQNDAVRVFAEEANTIVLRHINYLESTGLVDFAALPDPTKGVGNVPVTASLASSLGFPDGRGSTLLAAGIIGFILLGLLGYLYKATA